MEYSTLPAQQPRLGWHYFPDPLHYRDTDLTRWLPELQSLGASWLTLHAPIDYAIPEPFLSRLINANITPILHFQTSTTVIHQMSSIKTLLKTYASWGVRYVMFFDRPNLRKNWSPMGWAQDRLVERFLDLLIPYFEEALSSHLSPIFPPLEPGGNYWDTAFLSDAIAGLQRRGYSKLVNSIALSAYAKAGNRPLNWGAGGPERWPSSQPYFTPKDSQDQIGFRIFDWYLAVTNAVLGKNLPIFLFGGACKPGEQTDRQDVPVDAETHTKCHLSIVQALAGEEGDLEPLPHEILACCFSPLVTSPGHPESSSSWFQMNGAQLPVVNAMKNWVSSFNPPITNIQTIAGNNNSHPIAHYLLLTEELWHKLEKTSNFLRDFLQKFKPTIGFSLAEAVYARRVTIFGDHTIFPDSVVDHLLNSGCLVERILEDGTLIASNSVEP